MQISFIWRPPPLLPHPPTTFTRKAVQNRRLEEQAKWAGKRTFMSDNFLGQLCGWQQNKQKQIKSTAKSIHKDEKYQRLKQKSLEETMPGQWESVRQTFEKWICTKLRRSNESVNKIFISRERNKKKVRIGKERRTLRVLTDSDNKNNRNNTTEFAESGVHRINV